MILARSSASRSRRLWRVEKRQEWHNIVVEMMIEQRTKGISGFDRDILEWSIPEEVLAVLLKDSAIARKHI